MLMYYVYVLQSLNHDKRFYIGVTKDIEVRVKKHNNGFSKSTRPFKPWEIIYTEEYEIKEEAYKREYYLKNPKGYLEKRKIIENHKFN